MTALQPSNPLVGYTIGVTAARRREELVALLRRRGARVVEAPALRIMPLEDDEALRRATEQCLRAPLDYVVATTGVGWRGWLSAADGWGHGARLAEVCAGAVVLTRGPKATGAVRAGGLSETWSPATEATDELLGWLLARDLRGRRIAVQEHGAPLDGFSAALRERGAEVIPVPVYRWAPPEDAAPLRRLVEQTARREVHALTFTSAPAITAFLATADELDLRAQVLAGLRGQVLPVCVGPVCARPLVEAGITPHCPDRGRLGAMVRAIEKVLPQRNRRELRVGASLVTLQGNAVLVDGAEPVQLPPLLASVLRVLAEQPGHVLSRAELLRRAWIGTQADEHAVEAAIARLRGALGEHAHLVRTVPKRGYSLLAPA
ncbi:uroporphyrinogen-III synthase [Streptomyces tateyamensis]|uniref:Uroporphyrinogen-III synthase n=1 Tax=Streptomyces tateyamensis TaxID=565073 RepID=A0A2V4MZZ4_9ACTN|nr:uroporphyrinogen-III synthase [Streptomyces tateyamensis]PYC77032.1 uroporphyrinogen-III synthase [Streptomyces tateyamensis]